MKLHINNKIILIVFENKAEKTLIKDHFSFNDMSNVFVRGKFDARKIKVHCFVKEGKQKKYGSLYIGFLQDLLTFIKKSKIEITELNDERIKLEHQRKQWTDKKLKTFLPKFDYVGHQIRELKAMMKANIGIIKAPTSSGKSELFIAFIKALKQPALIVVNRVSLVLQTQDRLKKNGINAGCCHGKGFKPGDVMVSTIQSVRKIPDLTKYKILILDEVHKAQSNQFQEFLEKTSYPIRFGFSATPDCGDKFKFALIRQFFGEIIIEVEAEELLKNKVIAIPKIEFLDIKCKPTIDWPSANYRCILYNKKRNDTIIKLVSEYSLPTLILIRNIKHGEYLAEKIPNSVFVSGIDDVEKRRDIINKFENGEIQTIISTNIFNEGISINAIRVLIIAGGGKSTIEAIQRLGRGLRLGPKTGKTECLVYDFYDYGNLYTEKHSEIRKKIYKKVGFEVRASF